RGDAASVNPVAPPGRSVPLPWVWLIAALGVLAVYGYLRQALLPPRAMFPLDDLDVYRVAADRVVHGVSVYDTPLRGHTRGEWEFVYTPFAALLFVPLVVLHGTSLTLAGALGNMALLAGSVWAALSLLGFRRDRRLLIVIPAATAVLLWCEPTRQTIGLGQVNLLLLLLVLADMTLPDSSRWKGALTGIAAGIKLTPAFFILYLLVTGRFRAAAAAAGACAATLAIGLAVMPKDSLTFWSGAFADPARVGVPGNPDNESLRGLLARSLGSGGLAQLLWPAAALATALTCLVVARRLSATGQELAALTLCGMTAAAISPYTWIHHWVWLAPLLICAADLTVRRRSPLTAAALIAIFLLCSGGVFPFLGLPSESVLRLADPGHFAVIVHNAYIWLTVALLVTAAIATRHRPRPTARGLVKTGPVASSSRVSSA
ncbi:glycosyltransferase 87 family protein, partial [Nocardia sp. NPDC050789]